MYLSSLFLFVLYQKLIHNARTHLDYFPWRKTPGSRPLGPRFQLRRRKYGYSGEFGSFTTCFLAEAAASCSRAHGEMADLLGFMGSLGVWEFDHSPGRAGRPAASYPQVINKFIVFREFGSLKLLDTDRGPRAFLRTTRALGPRPFGPVP